MVGRLSILFKVSDLHEGVHFKKQVFLLFCFYPREKKKQPKQTCFLGRLNNLSSANILHGNIQIA